jgi:hypothetical protein
MISCEDMEGCVALQWRLPVKNGDKDNMSGHCVFSIPKLESRAGQNLYN